MLNISFQPMQIEHLPLWQKWIQTPHVKNIWLIEGYEPSDYIHKKIAGNGYDYPFIIYLNERPIGYIQCCDLYAYRIKYLTPKGIFSQETSGTFCMDLFFGETNDLNKGYGTQVVKAFIQYIFKNFSAKKILIDPASDNLRAIRCYEKAGFTYVREDFDGITNCTILEINKFIVPKTLTENLVAIYGCMGKTWLKNLPCFLSNCEKEWQLTLMLCYDNLSFNYVAPAILSNGTQAVLKCSPPHQGFNQEIAALKHFAGSGAVKLLQENTPSGKMLLECIKPGENLEKLNYSQKGVEISIEVMHKLHKPINERSAFPNIKEWFDGFAKLRQAFSGGTGPFPTDLIARAENISKALLATMGEQVLLHGDLHYGNILYSDERGWLAIDPKGVIGEREFEIPLPKLNESFTKKQLGNTLNDFLEITGFNRQRVLGWLFAKTVLAAWWVYEDQGSVGETFLYCAELVRVITESYNEII
jgi:streptomycin 6-kinase